MSRLIDADKYESDLIKAYDDVSMEFEVLNKQPTVKAIIIPEGATNGDMIEAMFPNAQVTRENDTYIYVENIDSYLPLEIFKPWWNAPYKAESEG